MTFTTEYIATDFLIIGGGVAGLRAAIELAQHGEVLIVTKDAPSESSSQYAQGGVAVALSDEDRISIHFEDTIKAGDGLCLHKAVHTLVEEGPARIRELIRWGAGFDREGSQLSFTREAAHSRNRVLHAQGDSTGREIVRTLSEHIRSAVSISEIDFAFTRDLIVKNGICVGAVVCRQPSKTVLNISARAVLLATGGAGHLYERTTNPEVSTGDGMAMAYRAGAILMDMEFVQFHPTALYCKGAPPFLLSEAMRGEGGILRNIYGKKFMDRYHSLRELAPRDIVARAIQSELVSTQSNHVFLDMTQLPTQFLVRRFPRIYSTCKEFGIDIASDPIPVSPASHFIMGGIKTDLWGATNVPGLFAAGEAACTGVHGANRLASNSLLEGLVFGARAGQAAARYAQARSGQKGPALRITPRRAHGTCVSASNLNIPSIRTALQKLMWSNAGIIRTKKNLQSALKQLREWDLVLRNCSPERRLFELKNMVCTAQLITRSALLREGSVGAHFRSDFPRKGKNWKKRTVVRK